jgi:predicted ribosome quality control (RQC) complex YloA/Tae2 family protein
MHFHHYSLLALSRAINDRFAGQRVQDCFTQNKHELVLDLDRAAFRIGLHTPLTYFVPVDEFAKAKRNVVSLFPQLSGRKLRQSRVVDNERILILEFAEGLELICKLHGPSSNAMLRQGGKIVALFKQQREQDWEFEETPSPWNAEALQASPPPDETSVLHALRQLSPIFERKFARAVLQEMQAGLTFSEAAKKLIELARNEQYYLVREKNRMRFLLFPPQSTAIQIKGIVPALQLFLRVYFQFDRYRQMYAATEKAIRKPYSRLQKLHRSYAQNIHTLETDRNPEEIGHILMANLHRIEARSKSVELEDYYQGGTITIKLDPRLNPQDNAQRYYAKHKRRRGKLHYLKEQLNEIEDKLLDREEQMETYEAIPSPQALTLTDKGFDYQELQPLRKLHKSLTKQGETGGQKRIPYRTFKRAGYEIFVGKGAANNDQLSFKFANKEDIWLHAKDVTGSHVIIRKRPGHPVPPDVLEYAAQLAAYYSKRKTDTLVPVQYTPRKYIRKRKGDPPGLVAVDREEVIMVEPGKQ